MQVSFIIPLFNCLPHTQECLRSLQATLPAGLSHEIIFVDDGSTDGTRAWLESLPPSCRVFLNEKNLGFAATCNRGAAEAQGDFLFFLNNDLVFQPGWFRPMLTLAQAPRSGLIGNIQLNAATGLIDHAGLGFNRKGQPVHTPTLSWLARLSGQREVAALTGACFAVQQSLWRQLGGFDEEFANGCEDVDLCLRARQAGRHNAIATHSVVRHHVSQSPGRKSRDEENSRRLLTRWRSVIAELSVRDACLYCWASVWNDQRNQPDPRLTFDGLLYLAHLRPRPTERLIQATQAAFEIEFQRWAHLIDGGPPPGPQPASAWQSAPPSGGNPDVI